MNKKKNKIIVLVIVLLLLIGGGVGTYFFLKKDTGTTTKKIQNEDTIKEYGYTIKKTDSKLKKEKFKELKTILAEKDINYEDYAKKLAEIFVVDVYDLNTKLSKYDVGGLEYVITDKKDEFKLLMQDTLYNNINDNNDNDRKQKLPIVKSATSEEITKESFKYKDNEYDSYNVKIKIDYKEDLGYDKNVLIKMIKKENKLFIVVVEPC